MENEKLVAAGLPLPGTDPAHIDPAADPETVAVS